MPLLNSPPCDSENPISDNKVPDGRWKLGFRTSVSRTGDQRQRNANPTLKSRFHAERRLRPSGPPFHPMPTAACTRPPGYILSRSSFLCPQPSGNLVRRSPVAGVNWAVVLLASRLRRFPLGNRFVSQDLDLYGCLDAGADPLPVNRNDVDRDSGVNHDSLSGNGGWPKPTRPNGWKPVFRRTNSRKRGNNVRRGAIYIRSSGSRATNEADAAGPRPHSAPPGRRPPPAPMVKRDDQVHADGTHYPWTAGEIRHKVRDAARKGSPKTYVGNAVWDRLDEEVEQIVKPAPASPSSGNGEATGKPKAAAGGQADGIPDGIRDVIEAQTKAKATPQPPAFTQLLSSADLLAMDLRPEFLVKGILVKGAPCIIGGRSKVLKTSLAVDLAISLGSGKPFLGRFEVPKPVKVAFWTGESGAPTIRETALRIAKSKAIDLSSASVLWSFDLPKLCRADHLRALEAVIREQRLEVIIIDPLYLSLLSAETAGNAGNLYAMGAALEPLSRLAQATGATVILLHHFKKSGIPDTDNPAALEDLSQSGGSRVGAAVDSAPATVAVCVGRHPRPVDACRGVGWAQFAGGGHGGGGTH